VVTCRSGKELPSPVLSIKGDDIVCFWEHTEPTLDYLIRKNEKARRYKQLGAQTKQFIKEVERVGAARRSLISTRFDLRSIIR
jgi:hypothetical protein